MKIFHTWLIFFFSRFRKMALICTVHALIRFEKSTFCYSSVLFADNLKRHFTFPFSWWRRIFHDSIMVSHFFQTKSATMIPRTFLDWFKEFKSERSSKWRCSLRQRPWKETLRHQRALRNIPRQSLQIVQLWFCFNKYLGKYLRVTKNSRTQHLNSDLINMNHKVSGKQIYVPKKKKKKFKNHRYHGNP